MSTRPLCYFHRNCMDGRASAAVVQLVEPDAEFIALQYGMRRPGPAFGRKVYIVDFGFPLEEMRQIEAEASEVIWIDHHRSHLSTHEALGWGHFDLEHSGASLTWQVLFPDQPPPPVIEYVRDKDLWLWQLPDSRAINAGLDKTYTTDGFQGLLDIDLDQMRRVGEPALKKVAKQVDKIVARGVPSYDPFGLRGQRALVVNNGNLINDVGERIYSPEAEGGLGYDLAIMFSMRSNGAWIHNLRSATVDCGRIADNRGGGGHPQAASYCASEPFPMSADCLDWPSDI